MAVRVKEQKINPRVRDVLMLLGAGAFLAASLVMPGLPLAVKPFLDEARRREAKDWKKFNLGRLRWAIKRLEKQKMVEVVGEVVKITEKGKQKLLKFNLEEMELENRRDGKWRLIIYDISDLRKPQRDFFRLTLERLKFLRLQESVYLTPFVCDREVEYLKHVFNIGEEVQVLQVTGIANEELYKDYFGI